MKVFLLSALTIGACSVTDGDVLRSRSDAGTPSFDAADSDAGLDCSLDGPCPLPAAGDFTVCGRVYDLETTEPLTSTSALGSALSLSLYDLSELDDREDPPIATTTPDECGWYFFAKVPGLVSGAVALTSDDTAQDGEVLSWVGSAVEISPGQVRRVNAFALSSATEASWAQSAGLAANSFAQGSLFTIYSDLSRPPLGPFQGAPVSGVEITRNGVPLGGDDYYFSDPVPLDRRTINPALATTGANGSGLMTGLALSNKASGTKAGCDFVEVIAMTLQPIVQVQEIRGTCN